MESIGSVLTSVVSEGKAHMPGAFVEIHQLKSLFCLQVKSGIQKAWTCRGSLYPLMERKSLNNIPNTRLLRMPLTEMMGSTWPINALFLAHLENNIAGLGCGFRS